MGYKFDEATWAACYDDKHPNNNVVEYNEETGEYQFISEERKKKH